MRKKKVQEKFSYTITTNETALIRIDKLDEDADGNYNVRFIDLELSESMQLSINKSSEILSQLDINGITVLPRQLVNTCKAGYCAGSFSISIYPSFPEATEIKIQELEKHFYKERQKGCASLMFTIFSVPLCLALTILIVFMLPLFPV